MPTAHHFVNHMVSYFSSPSYLQNKWLIFFGLSFIFTSLFLPAFRCDLLVKWLESMLLLTFFLASSELLGGNLLMITVRCCARRFWYIASCVWHNEIPLTNVLQLFKLKFQSFYACFRKIQLWCGWTVPAVCFFWSFLPTLISVSFGNLRMNCFFGFSLHSSLFRSLNFDWFAARFLWL